MQQLLSCDSTLVTIMLVAVELLLLLTLIVVPCSADTDLHIEQLLLYNTVHGDGTWIYANESITAEGCFMPLYANATNLDTLSAAVTHSGLTIAVSPFDNTSCFRIAFVLPDPGKHELEIRMVEVMNGSVTPIGTGSILVSVEVQQRENCWHLAVYNENSSPLRGVIVVRENNTRVWLQIRPNALQVSASEETSFKQASLGAVPVVTLKNGTDQETFLMVEWTPDQHSWLLHLGNEVLENCGVECSLEIQMSANVGHCQVERWHGTLLVASTVPILEWISGLANTTSGEVLSNPSSHAATGTVAPLTTHLQCHPEIAVVAIGPWFTFTENMFRSAINSTSHHLCNMVPLLYVAQCSTLTILDVALTYTHLLILTSDGLLVSGDPAVFPALSPTDPLPFSVQGAHFIKQNTMFCQYPLVSSEQVFLAAEPTSTQNSQVYVAVPPFQLWQPLPSSSTCNSDCGRELASIAYDFQRQTYLTVVSNNSMAMVYVLDEVGQPLNSGFQLPGEFNPTSIYYHPPTAVIYLVGNGIWSSINGGHTFYSLFSLPLGEAVIKFALSSQALAFLTSTGIVFYGRPGSSRVAQLDALLLPPNVTELLFDSAGVLITSNQGLTETAAIPVFSLLKDISYHCDGLPVDSHLLYLYGVGNTTLCADGSAVGLSIKGSATEGLVVDGAPFVTTFQHIDPETSLNSEWTVQEGTCWLWLQPRKGFDKHVHELDMGDHIELEVESILVDSGEMLVNFLHHIPKHFWDVSVTLGNPELFDVHTTRSHHLSRSTVGLHIWTRNSSSTAVSTITFQLKHCSLTCKQCALTTLVSTSCPSNKYLKFVYPDNATEEHLFELPVNYRPASWMGSAIPLSPHVYNVDPSLPLMYTQYSISKGITQFKQCSDSITRSGCNCSQEMEMSTDIAMSDCIQRVYRHSLQENFPLHFNIHLSNGTATPVQIPLQIEELNNRTDFTIIGQADDAHNNPEGHLILTFQGPGLYHFKGSLVGNHSFCELTTQVTVYIDTVPLVKAAQFSVVTTTTIVFGVVTFIVYLLYHYHYARGDHK